MSASNSHNGAGCALAYEAPSFLNEEVVFKPFIFLVTYLNFFYVGLMGMLL